MTSLPSRHEIIRKRLEAHFEKRAQRSSWLPVAFFIIPAAMILIGALLFSAPRSTDGVSLTPVSILGGFTGAIGDLYVGNSFQPTAEVDADDETTSTSTPKPTPEPTPTPIPMIDVSGVTGSPYAGQAVIDQFKEAGLNVTQRPVQHAGFAALSGQAVGLQVGDGNATDLVLVVYESSGAVGNDWQTNSGQAPRLKSGHSLPEAESIWWNRNVVVVVLDRGGSSSAAFDAFFKLR